MEVQFINKVVFIATAIIISIISIGLLQALIQWVRALHSNVNVSYFRLVGMRLRKGNVLHTVQTVIDANKANVKLDFKEAAALDLAGDKMLEVAKNIAKKQVLERHHLNQK